MLYELTVIQQFHFINKLTIMYTQSIKDLLIKL